jgi:hypothetical protein
MFPYLKLWFGWNNSGKTAEGLPWRIARRPEIRKQHCNSHGGSEESLYAAVEEPLGWHSTGRFDGTSY